MIEKKKLKTTGQAIDYLNEAVLGKDPDYPAVAREYEGVEPLQDRISEIEQLVQGKTPLNKVTWQALKDLRDSSTLVPGQQYRITDYECTTVQKNTRSAGHQFDIIVTADDVDKLNEQVRAIQHAGDTYFANSKLEAWQVWYCLDNDTNRFAWADTVNGKGVIYRMIDEFNNDVPYDFKNIQFIRKITDGELDLVGGVDTWVYTFTGISYENNTLVDGTTLKASEYFTDEGGNLYKNNSMGIYEVRLFNEDGFDKILETLSDNVFIGGYDEVPYDEDGPAKLVSFSFNNELGRDCINNTFGNDCYNNSFGSFVQDNSFGNDVSRNSFGNSVYNNSFGNSVYNNTFGNDVNNNSFGNYFVYNTVKNYVQYVRTPDTMYPNWFKYVTLENGLAGASAANRLNLEGIQAVVGYNAPIKVARGVGEEIVAVWQNGIALAGLRKASPTTADWS